MSNQTGQKINVLFLAAEAAPLVKVGGLGDVAGSLPIALRLLDEHRLDVRLVLPFHRDIRQKLMKLELVAVFEVNHPDGPIPARAYLTDVLGLPVYLIEGSPIPVDGNVYNGSDPTLDGNKYVFFSLACLELANRLGWKADILHANDWHTALAVYANAHRRKSRTGKNRLRTVITVHNLPFMGKDAEMAVNACGLPRVRDQRLPYWAKSFPLPLGMLGADKIVAVSPGYAEEILTPEFGCGLQDFLATRRDDLSGILNGLEKELWNPATDANLSVNFDIHTISARKENKLSLQEEFGLPRKPDTPLLIIISRMDQQKGIDIAISGLRQAAELDWQAIILGTGDTLLESACRSLEAEFPERVRTQIRFDVSLSRRMYAGGDILLMPSRYEPCGLAQMIAMNYGCVPLARATGGLKDTIRDDPSLVNSTGFLFQDPTADAFSAALQRALYAYPSEDTWLEIQRHGMQEDFGWEKPAAQYAALYDQLLGGDE